MTETQSAANPAHVKMYSTPWCPFCIRAKRLLDQKGVTYEDVDVSHSAEFKAEMIKLSGRRTVPQIFIEGKPIGGSDELHALEAGGRLNQMLRI